MEGRAQDKASPRGACTPGGPALRQSQKLQVSWPVELGIPQPRGGPSARGSQKGAQHASVQVHTHGGTGTDSKGRLHPSDTVQGELEPGLGASWAPWKWWVEQTRALVTSAWPEWEGVWEAQVRGCSHVRVGGIAPSTTGQTTPIHRQGIYRRGRQQNSGCGSPRPARQKPGALKADVRPTLQASGWGSSLLAVPAEGSRPTKAWTKYQPKAAVKCPSCHPRSKEQSWGGPTPSSSGSD